MKGLIIFLVVMLISATGMSFYLITELFANGMGSGSNSKKSWIEVTLLSDKPVSIEYLKITIISALDKEEEVINNVFSVPIIFSEKLIIAEDKNLGSKKCLSPEQPIIELPRLKIKNAQEQKICLQLNDDETCVVIGKKDVFPDGVSLYRLLSDRDEHPHWFKEPCFIGENMFASPGLKERFCVEAKDVFHECPGYPLKLLEMPQQPAPAILIRPENANIFIKLEAQDSDYPWRAHFCVASKPQGRLCHEVTKPFIVPGGEQLVKMPEWPDFLGFHASLSFRDLKGHEIKKYFE